jgi:hypothetical protein
MRSAWGSGVVCLLGDQWHNTSGGGTIFKASIRLLLILKIGFFQLILPQPIIFTMMLLTLGEKPWNKKLRQRRKMFLIILVCVI